MKRILHFAEAASQRRDNWKTAPVLRGATFQANYRAGCDDHRRIPSLGQRTPPHVAACMAEHDQQIAYIAQLQRDIDERRRLIARLQAFLSHSGERAAGVA